MRLKEIEGESSNKSIGEDICNKLLEERMDEILDMSKKIDYNNLFYNKINFAVFGSPMYTYDQLKKGEKTLQQVEEEQKDF